MEETKIVKVYSNNSKKARIKRRKNKFQRIWDAEKQTYVKVRKAKYAVYPKPVKKDWRTADESEAIVRRSKTPKKSKSVPVKAAKPKTEATQKVHKEPARVQKKDVTIRSLNGRVLTWDNRSNKYKHVAQ